jgi:hypothetical protein
VYDHDPDEVRRLGWDEFIARQWESIFVGYRSSTGLRRTCRRWSDLLEAGLGCSQDTADLLVRAGIDLLEMGEIAPEQLEGLLRRHTRLRALARRLAFGPDAGDGPDTPDSPGIGSNQVTPAG